MRGDILLYRSGRILKDRIVCAYSAGPFCHCEIDLGDGTTIGAHSEDGIARRPEAMLDRRVVIALSHRTTPERIEDGLVWVLSHVGEPFSWASIADLALPRWLSTLLFGRRTHYNCANLVAKYVEIAGGLDLRHGKSPPMTLSPNDIARAVGLLPSEADHGWSHLHRIVAKVPPTITALVPHRFHIAIRLPFSPVRREENTRDPASCAPQTTYQRAETDQNALEM